jgi:hypothetical protein
MAGAPDQSRILVAGVGNVLRGDDGFGVVTAWKRLCHGNGVSASGG